MRTHRASLRGFTLIELLIVVAIVAIIAIIALPSYERQVINTRRVEGKTALLGTAQIFERCYTRFGRYDAAGCSTSLPYDTEHGHYAISAVIVAPANFTLAATPMGAQARDQQCGVLRLSSTGQRGSQNQADDTRDCW